MRCAAYLRLSRVEQNNGMAIERQLFAIEKAIKEFEGSLDHILQDLMSGRKSDRPNIEKLEDLIARRAIDAAIFYRVDRLGRDVELLSYLGKMFEKTGVRVYVCARGGFIDWKKTEDWEYWMSAALAAEKESRVIAERLRQAHEFNRHKNQASFKVPLGYDRVDRHYQISQDDYANWLIQRFIENEGNLDATIRDSLIRGKRLTSSGLRSWLRNPLHRQLIPTGQMNEDGTPEKRRLISFEQDIKVMQLLKERSLNKSLGERRRYTLTGFTECKCGAICSISNQKKNNYAYIRCRAGDGNYEHFDRHPHRGIRFDFVEMEVVKQLCEYADLVVDRALRDVNIEETKTDAERKIERQIESLRRSIAEFGDEDKDYDRQIKKLQIKLSGLNEKEADFSDRESLRNRLSELREIECWTSMSPELRREAFYWFVDRVFIDFPNREVKVRFLSF